MVLTAAPPLEEESLLLPSEELPSDELLSDELLSDVLLSDVLLSDVLLSDVLSDELLESSDVSSPTHPAKAAISISKISVIP